MILNELWPPEAAGKEEAMRISGDEHEHDQPALVSIIFSFFLWCSSIPDMQKFCNIHANFSPGKHHQRGVWIKSVACFPYNMFTYLFGFGWLAAKEDQIVIQNVTNMKHQQLLVIQVFFCFFSFSVTKTSHKSNLRIMKGQFSTSCC